MTPRPPPVLLLLACALAATLALAATPPQGVPSSAIYPPRVMPLRFDHSRHVEGMGLTCVYCHTGAATSARVDDRLLPPPSRCDACHGTDHDDLAHVRAGVGPAEPCAYCHEGHREGDANRVPRVVLPAANLKFDHAAHRDLGIPCVTCHPGTGRGTTATEGALPKEATCTRCHAESATGPLAAGGDCDVCHLTRGGRLVTHFDSGKLLPTRGMRGLDHGPDWIERHKLIAGTDSARCATCHSESECVECHDGRVRPRRVHPNDWLSLHAVTARQDGPSCGSCHRAQSFCITCHERTGVTMSGPLANARNRGRFHPSQAIWSGMPRTRRHHAEEAERNIAACVSCHTERDCALCHATPARGGQGRLSPHPPNFAASCARALSKNPRPCLFCHDAQEGGEGRLAPCR